MLPRRPACLQVNLGSLQPQLAALQQLSGEERISPTLDAILELLDEAPAEGAAAEAEEFVRQVVEAADSGAGSGTTLAMPWALRGGGAAGAEAEVDGGVDGGAADEGEAAMEGVVGEYAYAALPALEDAPLGEPGCRQSGARPSVQGGQCAARAPLAARASLLMLHTSIAS